MNGLTDRQRMVLEYICGSIDERGYPPTLREIGNKLGIRSTNGVNDHLRALERKGFLTREDMKSRTLRPTEATLDLVGHGTVSWPGSMRTVGLRGINGGKANGNGNGNGGSNGHAISLGGAANDAWENMVEVPILGRVAAGPLGLTTAFESPSDTVRIDRMLLGQRGADVFGLRIKGDSMIEAGIHDGDYVFVRKTPTANRGAIVIAMVGEEATCKYFFPEASHVRLEPANAAMAAILVPRAEWRETNILGVVVGIYRKM
jgi:repressor LexA